MSQGTVAESSSPVADLSAFAPLRRDVFRSIWVASLASNLGTWIQNVGAAWLMTDLSSSPLIVSLVQASTTLPVFLIGLPAGALADIVDRRKLLLISQTWMLLMSGLLAALTAAGQMTPTTLLLLTCSMGLGFALNAPAWQAIIPELVPRQELQAAISLNSVSMNASRAVGPAIGGVVVASAGPAAAFLLNSLSFVAVLFVIYRWDRPREAKTLPGERLFGAMKAGLRYVRHSPAVRSVMIRGAAFVTGASGLWGLLPALVREDPTRGPGAYGILLGCVGFGAVAVTFVVPPLRQRLGSNGLLVAATLLYAGGMALISLDPHYVVWCLLLVPIGAAWLVGLTSLSGAVQSLVPAWVRARVIAVYLLVFFGGMTTGSILWGVVASRTSPKTALLGASAWMAVGLLASIRYKLPTGPQPDIEPSRHWPEAPIVPAAATDEPVLVQVEYLVPPEHVNAFIDALQQVKLIRLRDGAIRWDLFEDAERPGRFVETFLVESWTEHLRQHDRVTAADRLTERAAAAYHQGEKIKVTHLITATRRPK